MVLIGINLLAVISSTGNGIAYIAHLGGGLFGYLYLKSEWIRMRIHTLRFNALKDVWRSYKTKHRESRHNDLEKETDRILDKITKHGMESLSPRERKILEKKSRL